MVKLSGVVLRQKVKFVGNGKDYVKVRGGQQFLFPRSKPAFARLGLAVGAVPIATRNGELSITCIGLNRYAVAEGDIPIKTHHSAFTPSSHM